MPVPKKNLSIVFVCNACGHRWSRRQTSDALSLTGVCPRCGSTDTEFAGLEQGDLLDSALDLVKRLLRR